MSPQVFQKRSQDLPIYRNKLVRSQHKPNDFSTIVDKMMSSLNKHSCVWRTLTTCVVCIVSSPYTFEKKTKRALHRSHLSSKRADTRLSLVQTNERSLMHEHRTRRGKKHDRILTRTIAPFLPQTRF